MRNATRPATRDALLERVAELERALAAERAAPEAEQSRADEAVAERDRLREAYRHLQLEVEIQRRRLVVAKAERIDTTQLELEFAAKLAALDAVAGQLAPKEGAEPAGPTEKPTPGKVKRSTGRRDLKQVDLPEERIEIIDPALEGSAPRMGTEDSCKLVWRRGSLVRLVIARVKYRVGEMASDTAPAVATAAMPDELIVRSLAAPSLLAHVVTDKLCDGRPAAASPGRPVRWARRANRSRHDVPLARRARHDRRRHGRHRDAQ